MRPARQIIIAGAGIAGLTAALAFARRGFSVTIFERAAQLQEVGAGLQLSPNATRILDRLGVLPELSPAAVRPEAVILRDAGTLAELARVPLGSHAEKRWKAPYLVAHRADLQNALLARVARETGVHLVTGACVRDIAFDGGGVTASVDVQSGTEQASGALVIAADGVWSTLRSAHGGAESRFSGQLAWRATVLRDGPAGSLISRIGSADAVTAYLHPGFHLIAYPVRGGSAVNLAAFTPGTAIGKAWSGDADIAILKQAMRNTAPALTRLVDSGVSWTAWPIHTVDRSHPWTAPGGFALIGDAAHAMTPFAAQGAAMAIEDAETLASFVAASPGDLSGALAAWEASRRPRVQNVARRGTFNRFVWHASGPVALVRNLVLRTRQPEKLAADLDWLYGFETPEI